MAQPSAIPNVYYAIFGLYEPLLTIVGFLGALADPKTVHDQQAPWPAGNPPPDLPRASLVTTIQLGHVCALLGLLNFSVLTAARKHLHSNLAMQEKIVSAMLTPLVFGDVLHIYVTLWALGDQRWELRRWSPMLWSNVLLGSSLLIPRVAWHLGIGRYVNARDKLQSDKKSDSGELSSANR